MNHRKLRKLSAAYLVAIVILAGCHKKVAAPLPPPPPTPPTLAPTASIAIRPLAIESGETAALTWQTRYATEASISGIGTVPVNGTQNVSPAQSETYTLTAKGPGGMVEATARITVNPPPPAPTAPLPPAMDEQLFERNMHDVYFDYDKSSLRGQDSALVSQDAAFLNQYPETRVVIEGHCDERGSAEYNIALGQDRAESLEKALVSAGVPASRIHVVSVGKEQPFCTQSNEQCWQQNRRGHLKLDH